MRELAKQSSTELLTLNKVAMMVENPDRRPSEPVNYVDYALPRGRIPFARSDMVKQLFSLRGLKAPLKADLEDAERQAKTPGSEAAASRARAELEQLNKLNEALFYPELVTNPKMRVGQVQVLTNKPRSVYYITTVTSFIEPSMSSYFGDVLPQAVGKDSSRNLFVDQVQQEFGKRLIAEMSAQLRAQASDFDISDQAKKQFGDDVSH